VTEIVNYDIIR